MAKVHPVILTLRERRRILGLKADDVAVAAKVCRTSVSRWENGRADPGLAQIAAYAAAVGMTLEAVVSDLRAVTADEALRDAFDTALSRKADRD